MNIEGEPYSGVTALFNADVATGCPEWAPREHWLVLGPQHIMYILDTLFDARITNKPENLN